MVRVIENFDANKSRKWNWCQEKKNVSRVLFLSLFNCFFATWCVTITWISSQHQKCIFISWNQHFYLQFFFSSFSQCFFLSLLIYFYDVLHVQFKMLFKTKNKRKILITLVFVEHEEYWIYLASHCLKIQFYILYNIFAFFFCLQNWNKRNLTVNTVLFSLAILFFTPRSQFFFSLNIFTTTKNHLCHGNCQL